MYRCIIYDLGMQSLKCESPLGWLDVFLTSYRHRLIDHIIISIVILLLTIAEQLYNQY